MAKSSNLVKLYYVKVVEQMNNTVCRNKKSELLDTLVQLESILSKVSSYEHSLLSELDVD